MCIRDSGITNLTVLEETGKNLVLRKLAAQEADKLGVIGRNLNRIGYILSLIHI